MSSRQEPRPISDTGPLPRAAVAQLAAHYPAAYPKLTAIAAGVLGRRDDAEDVVQQAARIALEKGEIFDSGPQFVAWLVGVVRHCALNHRRKTGSRRTYPVDPLDLAQFSDEAVKEGTASSICPDSGELLSDQTCFDDAVLLALQGLSVEARCCLLLRTVQKLSYAEISELLQIPEGTATSHVYRSKQVLRERLAKQEMPRGSEAAPKK